MDPQLIIFDLDGTLVDSLDDLTEAVNHMRQHFALSPLVRDQVQTLVGQGARNLVERALPGLPPATVNRGLELFLAYNEAHLADHTCAYPGVPELLTVLDQRGLPLVVVSNKEASLCRLLLSQLGLAGYFRQIYGADSFPERKPSPLPFLEVARLMQVSPAATVVVGDSSNDVLAALAADMRVIGCSYGYGTSAELLPASARVAVVAELLPLLGVEVIA
jgi:phosphoglycolate phosphatase